jgi:hypothetical protein
MTGGVFHSSGGASRDAVAFEQKRVAKHTYEITLPVTLLPVNMRSWHQGVRSPQRVVRPGKRTRFTSRSELDLLIVCAPPVSPDCRDRVVSQRLTGAVLLSSILLFRLPSLGWALDSATNTGRYFRQPNPQIVHSLHWQAPFGPLCP